MSSNLKMILITLLVVLGTSLILMIVREVAFRLLRRGCAQSDFRIDDIILQVFRTPSIYWCLAIGLYIGLAVSDIPLKYVSIVNKAINVIMILSISIAAANLAGNIFTNYIKKSNLPIPTTGLAYGIMKGTILTVGALIILSVLGISIAPLITALGVGGLAVALALQDTLANLFAGIHVLLERSIKLGDFVRLETGQEGHIADITWRTTRIRMLTNNMVVIPNSKLAQSIVTNFYMPEKRMFLSIQIGVSYAEDPERIEKILLEEARNGAGKIPGLLADPEPVVRLIPGFGDSSLDFTLTCQVLEVTDQYSVQHELRKRIFKRFREEGIEIPFPHRTIYLREEKDWRKHV